MNMRFIRKLPIPRDVKQEYPVPDALREVRLKNIRAIRAVLSGESDKMLLIIGPCSADREDSVLEYLTRLRKVADQVSDKLVIVPRIYTNKPRTTGDGYKGMLHQPDPTGRAGRADRHSHDPRSAHEGADGDGLLLRGRDALSREPPVHGRSARLRRRRRAQRGEPGPPPHGERAGRARRHEEPDLGRLQRHAQRHHRRPAQPHLRLPQLGGRERGQPLRPRDPARLCEQARPEPAELSL